MADQSKDTPQKGKQQGSAANTDELHEHERVDAMMPWIHRGELESDDRDLVSKELAQSPAFQAKLAQESDLVAALDDLAADEVVDSAADDDAAWTRFKARLPEAALPAPAGVSHQPKSLPKSRANGAARSSAWRRIRLPQTRVGWLATAQTAVLAALAFLFIPGQLEPQPEEYRLLSSDDPATQTPVGNVVLMLDPASDQATFQALLSDAKARIVDGPMANGGYVLQIDAGDFDAGLVTLQASEAVVLAEPLREETVR